MNDLQRFLHAFQDEHARTVKIMQSYPSDKMTWRPHDRSFDARDLMMRFVGEQMILGQLPKGGFPAPPSIPPTPDLSLDQVIGAFEQGYQSALQVMKSVSESEFDNGQTSFFGRTMKLSDACWIPVNDQIHHRGQLSVYIRMAGGKVPSIYGPSADDPGV
jgi:DinB family